MHQVGVLIEHPGLYPRLSAKENLKIKSIALGIKDAAKQIDEIIELVGLENTGKKPCGSFSLGMRQRLGIALAVIGQPKLIILDEPINGLDPQGIVEVRKMLETLRDEKKITIMISSHILEELEKLADSYGIIHEGLIIDEFSTEEFTKKCGQFVTIKTGNNEKTVELLKKSGFKDVSIDNDHHIRVGEALKDTAKMAKLIVNANIDLNEIIITNTSLEDYYLSVTGGKHNG